MLKKKVLVNDIHETDPPPSQLQVILPVSLEAQAYDPRYSTS